jgi:predicted phosphoribosyltransferase
MATPTFGSRSEAGRELARCLVHLKDSHPVVLGVPRGGVLVAAEVVRALQGPLELMIVRRITAPGHPDVTVGAVIDGAQLETFCDEAMLAAHGMSRATFDAEVARLRLAVASDVSRYATGRPRAIVQNRGVVIAEDTIVTGATARIAAWALYKEGARYVAMAAPVAVAAAAEAIKDECDELVVLARVTSVDEGRWSYADSRPVSDFDVVRCMREIPAPP